ncbi:MAG TPA: VOC family protein [Longimicrobiales bacterium]|nr:VOC family protein [Longimicrobiales bacterium]
MNIGVKTSGLHHVSLRTRDLPRSRRFYHEVLGFAVVFETDDLCLVKAGGAMIGLRAPTSETAAGDAFDPFRVGMDHVALGCESREELDRVAAALEAEGVWTTGVKELAAFGAHYVAFKDPDGIKLELWLDG